MAKLESQVTRITLPATIFRLAAGALLVFSLALLAGPGALEAEAKPPAHASSASSKGNPDTDGDGVRDKQDACPLEPGPKSNRGCPLGTPEPPPDEEQPPPESGDSGEASPDYDNDGVADGADYCPARAGVASNNGCPAGEAKPGPGQFVSGGTEGAITNRNAFLALANSAQEVTLPAGTYYVDQPPSKSHIVVNNFSGTFTMLDGAEVRFLYPDGGGVKWSGGNAPKFFGLRSLHGATTRDGMDDAFGFFSTTDMVISGAHIDGAGSAGLLIWQTVRPTILNSHAQHTMADGIHIVASSNATVRNWSAYRTGDDGLSFQTYTEQWPQSSGVAENITVIEGGTRGITVLGSRDVTIRNFVVRNTWTSGLYVECTYHYNDCASKPVENVLFENGKVYDAGRHPKGVGSNPDSITVWKSPDRNIVFKDIESYTPVRDCFRAFDGGGATLINVRGDGAGCPAF